MPSEHLELESFVQCRCSSLDLSNSVLSRVMSLSAALS